MNIVCTVYSVHIAQFKYNLLSSEFCYVVCVSVYYIVLQVYNIVYNIVLHVLVFYCNVVFTLYCEH